ncbi:MOT10-like protein [Mya arenaria]|uniref:MOT10-like protein n=1 Tax=Mya arenaria TaxID=6604 RepID=A0ABY7EF31_MYAAR|nr:MOT10-like protein [Mya arenaria]
MTSAENRLIKDAETNQGVELLEKEVVGPEKDTKYSWFVCACAFISQIFVLGVLHAFGVFFVEFIKEFKSAKGSTAWIGSLAYGLSMTFGPVTSWQVSRFGYSRVMITGGVICAVSLLSTSFVTSLNPMFFTFSLLYGIGTCMTTSPTMTITSQYFDKYLAVATGITVSGSSFGTLIMGPLSQAIIDKAGWRTAFRVYAGFCLITSVLNSRIRTPAYMKCQRAEGRSFIKDLQIWKNRVFVVWTLSITFVMFGFYIPYVHLVSYAIDQGVSPELASILMMILGAATALGRIMFGRIVAAGVLNRLHMHQLSMVITGAGVMVLPLIKSYPGIVAYVVTVGLVDGCFVVLLPIITAQLMGIENSLLAWGFMIGTCSLTFTLGPPAAGKVPVLSFGIYPPIFTVEPPAAGMVPVKPFGIYPLIFTVGPPAAGKVPVKPFGIYPLIFTVGPPAAGKVPMKPFGIDPPIFTVWPPAAGKVPVLSFGIYPPIFTVEPPAAGMVPVKPFGIYPLIFTVGPPAAGKVPVKPFGIYPLIFTVGPPAAGKVPMKPFGIDPPIFTVWPPAAGALYDMTGNYDLAFHCAGIPILVGSVVLFFIPWAQRTSRGPNILSSLITDITIAPGSSGSGEETFPSPSDGTLHGDRVVENIALRSRTTETRTLPTSEPVSSYVDKATSTESLGTLSLDVRDVLSQLSHTSAVFEEMIRRSEDAREPPSLPASVTSSEVPRLPPPSEPVRYRRHDDRSRESSLHSQRSGRGQESWEHSQEVASKITTLSSPPSVPSFFIPPAPVDSQSNSLSAVGEPSRSLLFNKVTSTDSTLTAPMQPTSGPTTRIVSASQSAVEPGLTRKRSDFDQAISEHVNVLRETLRSPTSCSSRLEDTDHDSKASSPRSKHSSVSPAIDIIRSDGSCAAHGPDPDSHSDSFQLAQQIAFIEAATRATGEEPCCSHDVEPSSLTATKFDQENQLTVIPVKKATTEQLVGQRLENLFLPISEDDPTEKTSSYELVDVGSGSDVRSTRSRGGELDVFNHLFNDDEAR